MTTKYALSYHNVAAVDEILENCVFEDEEEAISFIDKFNASFDHKGVVAVPIVCVLTGHPLDDEQELVLKRIGWTAPLKYENIYFILFHKNDHRCKVLFPPYEEVA